MFYTLGQAAKATGKSKPTIQRAIKAGRMSAILTDQGHYEIDPAELYRVYPPVTVTGNATDDVKQTETPIFNSALQSSQPKRVISEAVSRPPVVIGCPCRRHHWSRSCSMAGLWQPIFLILGAAEVNKSPVWIVWPWFVCRPFTPLFR